MRTARSWTSGENFGGLLHGSISQRMEPPQNPGRFKVAIGAIQFRKRPIRARRGGSGGDGAIASGFGSRLTISRSAAMLVARASNSVWVCRSAPAGSAPMIRPGRRRTLVAQRRGGTSQVENRVGRRRRRRVPPPRATGALASRRAGCRHAVSAAVGVRVRCTYGASTQANGWASVHLGIAIACHGSAESPGWEIALKRDTAKAKWVMGWTPSPQLGRGRKHPKRRAERHRCLPFFIAIWVGA